jgi:E3 ubiquitin-protein ligase TRIP12
LVAGEDSDIPRNLHNIVVSIHAIATFQALHDYLRPRVSGLLSSGSRLSGMLAALAASGFGPGASSRTTADELRQGTQDAPPTESSNASAGSSSASAAPEPPPTRRRSLRLSAKNASSPAMPSFATEVQVPRTEGTTQAEMSDASTLEHPIPESSEMAAAATEDTVMDSGIAADFTDDEIDADVCCSMFVLPTLFNMSSGFRG